MDDAGQSSGGFAGDGRLCFDLPAGAAKGGRRVHYLTVAEFVDRWHHGANRTAANPKRLLPLHLVDPASVYTGPELADLVGLSKPAIHLACRQGLLGARKTGRTWLVEGRSFVSWRRSVPEHTRFSIRERLERMQIRQLDEVTADVVTATVRDCRHVGRTTVYELRGDGFSLAVGASQPVLTTDGWFPSGEISPGQAVLVQRRGKHPDERVDGRRLRKIDGQWRSVWQRHQRERLVEEHGGCQECGGTDDLHIHHVIPVHVDRDRAFDPDNIVLLCGPCHRSRHRVQGWQESLYLYGHPVTVDQICDVGVRDTYEFDIDGMFPNVLVNGVVAHGGYTIAEHHQRAA